MTDLVSALSPANYTELALALFLAVYVAVVIRHGGKRRAEEHASCARIPLEDDTGGLR